MATTSDPYKRVDEAVERLQELAEEAIGLIADIKRRTRYHGTTVQSALLHYLEGQNVPRSEDVIAKELWEGGVTTTSDFDGFTSTVGTTLQRLSDNTRIHRTSGGYVLGPRPSPNQPVDLRQIRNSLESRRKARA